MRIKLNGSLIDTESKSVLELLQEYKIEAKSVAVAINLEIVKQDKWDSYLLQENDVVECLTFMGGG
ncbi:sulfur carrier protein ThiS [Helicobacter rodentium]|uniref:sulfur carrier protein ThiS n=1 Tax=Helicobacter rodentium TaxID=59617 RepID=UPI002356256B|nr:sulfur carrier protein ThiS [Helicobacter rodentium]